MSSWIRPQEMPATGALMGTPPRVHGSGLFTRGQTQVLSVCTLNTLAASQKLDTIWEEAEKRYMHHYNFPPYSVGEARAPRSTGELLQVLVHIRILLQILLVPVVDHLVPDGQIVLNPNQKQRQASRMDVTVAATREKVVMIEAGADEIPDEIMYAGIVKAHEEIRKQRGREGRPSRRMKEPGMRPTAYSFSSNSTDRGKAPGYQ